MAKVHAAPSSSLGDAEDYSTATRKLVRGVWNSIVQMVHGIESSGCPIVSIRLVSSVGSQRIPQRFFVLGGPQCGGKTTVKTYLYARYMEVGRASGVEETETRRNLVLLQVMRQLVMHERGIHSAIFIDVETEQEIIRRDLDRMDQILNHPEQRVFLDETSVFTLAHALRRNLAIDQHLAAYSDRLRALGAAILFLNVPPSVSWTRRKPRYEERLAGFPPEQTAAVLNQYRTYLAGVHEGFLEVARRLQLPTRQIAASLSLEDTLEESARAFRELADERRLQLRGGFDHRSVHAGRPGRLGITPNDRTAPSGSAMATAIVSGWPSRPINPPAQNGDQRFASGTKGGRQPCGVTPGRRVGRPT